MDRSSLNDEEIATLLIQQRGVARGEATSHALSATAVAADPAGLLAELYDRYFRQSFALAMRMLANQGQAEEVVQEVFMKLWQSPHSFNPERGRFASWLLSVVHHRCIDELRRNKRQMTINPPRTEGEDGEDMLARIPDERNDPEATAWLHQQQAAVRRALMKLSAVQRRVIELAYFGGMTQAEIATYLNEPLGTVKTRIRLGLQKMKTMLEAEGTEVD